MTDPNDANDAITNLEQDLRDLGWRPVEMVEPNTGVPFTRWFPPAKTGSSRTGSSSPTTWTSRRTPRRAHTRWVRTTE